MCGYGKQIKADGGLFCPQRTLVFNFSVILEVKGPSQQYIPYFKFWPEMHG